MNQITTHILDTTIGKPAQGVTIVLFQGANDEWVEISSGVTNTDGRLQLLSNSEQKFAPGIYKIRFETKNHFNKSVISTFYPYIEIIFEMNLNDHYHIPLLLSPYGYSTYRGS